MVGVLRDLVMKCRGPDMPMVVVGNKTDLSREVDTFWINHTILFLRKHIFS